MLDLQKRRVRLALFVAALIALSMTAEKFRELVGEESSSKSGKFTLLNCFDMGSGTLACTVKEGIKLYVYNIRSAHVESIRQRAIELSLIDALKEGLSAGEAAKLAQKAGKKSAKLASRQAKRILGPIISSGWDFFEAIYYEGTVTEGLLRGSGTLCGAYAGGFFGEQSLGKLGYLAGSHLGSWIGGRIGLMVYDVINGVIYLLQFAQTEETAGSFAVVKNPGSDDAYGTEETEETAGSFAVVENPGSDDSYGTEQNGGYEVSGKVPEYSEVASEESRESSGGWGFF